MKNFYLPSGFRRELRKPWGTPIFGNPAEVKKKYEELIKKKNFKKIITVGDRCSLLLFSDIKIFDGKIRRKDVEHNLSSSLRCLNPPGTIHGEVWTVVGKAIKENRNIFVEGEEDLLVIPVVLLSENSTAVVYGLFNRGICLIEVNDSIKQEFKELLAKFNSK